MDTLIGSIMKENLEEEVFTRSGLDAEFLVIRNADQHRLDDQTNPKRKHKWLE